VQLDGKPVGAGKPGPVFQKLRAAYDARIAAL
jgi:D-alanine transaminase